MYRILLSLLHAILRLDDMSIIKMNYFINSYIITQLFNTTFQTSNHNILQMRKIRSIPPQTRGVKAMDICSKLIMELVERSMAQSESSLFYRRQIENCEEYIKIMQEEATRDWEIPTKPCDLQNIEDIQFFHSEFCLKNKLSILQNYKEVQDKRASSIRSKKISIRSLKSRSSSNGFCWSQHKYSHLKEANSQKLKCKAFTRQLSLQKIALSAQGIQITRTQKQLRQAVIIDRPLQDKQNKKKTPRKYQLKKLKPEKDNKIPMLIEMTYKITNRESEQKTKQQKIAQEGRLVNPKLKLKASQSIKLNKLKISQYEPHMNSIKINSWHKFNEMIVENDPSINPKPSKQIKYYAGLVQ